MSSNISQPASEPSVSEQLISEPSVSEQPIAEPPIAEPPIAEPPVPKERSQLTLWSVATVFFLLGSAVATLTIWQLHKLYRATIAPDIRVEGTVQAKYGYPDGNELAPDPSGYFIESAGIGRVYLTGRPLEPYVGQLVEARGSVSGICGPKSIPCYPLVEIRKVGAIAAE